MEEGALALASDLNNVFGQGVKYVKGNALAGRRFPHWAALEAWLEEWAVTDLRVHGTADGR